MYFIVEYNNDCSAGKKKIQKAAEFEVSLFSLQSTIFLS